MNVNRLPASLAAAAFATTFGLAACDRSDTASREPTTVGQKIDKAIDSTQQRIAEAGDKTAQSLSRAGDKTMEKLSEAGQKTEQALTNAGEKLAEKTNEAVSAVRSSTVGDTSTASAGQATSRAISDTAITASIKTDFLKDPDLSVLKIDVDTKAGVVTLNGLAGDEPARQRAGKMASAIKGVKEVRNFLVVKRG